MITIHNIEQGTPEWHTAREGKFTGSLAYKLLKFGTSVRELTDEQSRSYSSATETGFGGNFHTRRGHILEDEAIELYEQIHGCRIERPGFISNSDYPNCLYSPDGLAGDTILEVKCFVIDKKGVDRHMQLVAGDIDIKILAQIHFGMFLTGRRHAVLIPYNPDVDPKKAIAFIDIPYNQKISDNFARKLAT